MGNKVMCLRTGGHGLGSGIGGMRRQPLVWFQNKWGKAEGLRRFNKNARDRDAEKRKRRESETFRKVWVLHAVNFVMFVS